MAGVAHLFSALQLQVDIIGRRLPKSAANQVKDKAFVWCAGSNNLTASARGLALLELQVEEKIWCNVAKLNTNSHT